MHLDILIDMKLLLCSVSSPGIAFLINRKLLLCSATSPRIALAILAKQSAGFAFLLQFVEQYIKQLVVVFRHHKTESNELLI